MIFCNDKVNINKLESMQFVGSIKSVSEAVFSHYLNFRSNVMNGHLLQSLHSLYNCVEAIPAFGLHS